MSSETPRTEAGKALVVASLTDATAMFGATLVAAIRRVEAEAAQLALREAAEKVRAMACDEPAHTSDSLVHRYAVLAILTGASEPTGDNQ